jgi:beta-lactam-binding protein with PASTA domain
VPGLIAAGIAPFVVGYLVASLVIFPAPDVVGDGISVPSLEGMTATEAEGRLTALGLRLTQVTRLPHPDVREGDITAQAPLPGQQLRSGGSVRVAVSSGVPRVVVPDVVGFSDTRARSLLEKLGFTIQESVEENDAPLGRVIRIEPEPGTSLGLPARVSIVLSAGPPAIEPDTTAAPAARDTVDGVGPSARAASGRWPTPARSSMFRQMQSLTQMASDAAQQGGE